MVNNIFVEMLALKILNEEINPVTNKPFVLEDIKKEEYKSPVKTRLDILIKEREDKENETITT